MSRVPSGANPSALSVAARRGLLDALEALDVHRAAVTVVGAQAVYLRSQEADFTVAAFTADGDLALDPERLPAPPLLNDVMEAAGFALATRGDGHIEPGKWIRTIEVDGAVHTIPVDLIVPAGVAGAGRRGARIPPHPRNAAIRAGGLEAALVDHDPMIVSSLEPARDSRAIGVHVTGVAALLVAKTHKIGDRLEKARTGRRDRLAGKDAGDVVRLMTTSSARQVGMTLHGLKDHPVADEATRTSLALLPAQFGTRAAPGVEMAVRALADGTRGEDGIRDLCVAYTRTLVRAAEAGPAVEPPS